MAKARNDLREIGAYTLERWGAEQCDRYLQALEGACTWLVDRPELRRPYRDLSPYWHAVEGKHVLFYLVRDDGEILVVRILHGAMLPERHLLDAAEELAEDDPGAP